MKWKNLLLILVICLKGVLENLCEKSKNSCLFCMTNKSKKWCSKCGNGHYLSSIKEEEGYCVEGLKIKNCILGDFKDPTNPLKCSKCKKGYHLSHDKKRCIEYKSKKNCDFYEKFENEIICSGCKNGFLDEVKGECIWNIEGFPDNCLFGGIIQEKLCFKCKEGYFLSDDGKECRKGGVFGCEENVIFGGKKVCLSCDEYFGFFAVDCRVVKVGGVEFLEQVCMKFLGVFNTYFSLFFLFENFN